MSSEEVKSRRPPDTPFKQQRLPAWQPILTPLKVVVLFAVIGVIFVPVGVSLLEQSNAIYEKSLKYDGSDYDIDCRIDEQNEGKLCQVSFTLDEDVDGPIFVYYELQNFYQNHRRYVKSRSAYQLQGQDLSESAVEVDCDPMVTNGSLLLNPCGLIANSLFNDIITLSLPVGVELDEDDISWPSDRNVKFQQIDGFKHAEMGPGATTCEEALGASYSDCKLYTDPNTGTQTFFWYPDDDNVQYLYESYPRIISPLEGVENEHFIVWMRTAGLPTFRKLYGKIHEDFKENDVISFQVEANFEVDSFDGGKSIVISTVGEFGGKNSFLGVAYIVVGSVSLLLAVLFGIKQLVSPRQLGDTRYLGWAK